MTDPVAMRHSTFEYTLTPAPWFESRKKTKLCLPNTQS